MKASNLVQELSRRTLLRGTLGGMAVNVGLPFLDCLLNENGTALAATGRPLPVRFGTWFWGLGFTPGRFEPKLQGANFDLLPELAPIAPIRNQVNVLTGFDAKIEGKTNVPHKTGYLALRTGVAPTGEKSDVPTIDVLISDAIGTDTRFRSLEMAATGNPRDSYSFRNTNAINPAEGSPAGFYLRVFGAEFQDPNAADFKPDPRVLMRLSVLSAVKEDRDWLNARVGSADKARLDEYLTSLRQIEQQLELQLEKPPPAAACSVPGKPAEAALGYDITNVTRTHKQFAYLLALTLACNQTKVFNMVYSDSGSNLRKPGSSTTHHTYTHEELPDKDLGYQVQAGWFIEQAMVAFTTFVQALGSVREGSGTLLDNTLVLAHSDSSFAKAHSIQAIPVLTAGKAGGRLKTGQHVYGNTDTVSRVGLTVQQAMGLSLDKWGTQEMQTAKTIPEILA